MSHYPVKFKFHGHEVCLTMQQAWSLVVGITRAMGDRYFVDVVHDYSCAATKRGKKYGKCVCPIIDEARP